MFQIAAHEELIPPEELYKLCRIGYEIACLQHGVCRVIARPFVGRTAADFKRTPNRRDFPVPPGGETLLDRLAASGWPVFGVGKIEDIFSGRGISAAVHTRSDSDGVDQTLKAMGEMERGLIFANLVDFDTLFGHRNDVPGFAGNLELLDRRLPDVWAKLRDDDVFILTADHGCDPVRSPPTTRGRTSPCSSAVRGSAPGWTWACGRPSPTSGRPSPRTSGSAR